jgi:hypothetical protein
LLLSAKVATNVVALAKSLLTDIELGMSPVAQADFDRLATFVAVADELSMEPFVSDDNQERLVQCKESDGSQVVMAHLCHPAFLKSAILPFRKLWLSSETCAFEKIRDLVFQTYPEQHQLLGHRQWFYDIYSQQLDEPADREWAKESRRDILDIWIYTQAIHVGKKELKKGKTFGRFTLQDFDQWAERIGRERFEYLFRSSLRVIAFVYVQFLAKLARPLFVLLQRDHGMVPGFEAAAALKYNPYPDPRYRITFEDPFWHLDKESMEETFDRLLERQTYRILKGFLRAYFEHKPDALAAVCEYATFSAMMQTTGAILLEQDDAVPDQLMCHYQSAWGTAFGPVDFKVYAKRKVRFVSNSEKALADAYADFRSSLFEERRHQRREWWNPS